MKSKVVKCTYCHEELPTYTLPHITLTSSAGLTSIDDSRSRAKENLTWKNAEKLVEKNPQKYSIKEDSFGPAIWWIFSFAVSHESEEERQIIHWVRTGEGPEPE